MGIKSNPKEQVTVRLSAALVHYMDELVAAGVFTSRAAFLDQAAERQRRYHLALGDLDILVKDQEKDDLDELAQWGAHRPLDLD
jgi:Arc/MetJ-type ribon-helix-helix transcriptional regulator